MNGCKWNEKSFNVSMSNEGIIDICEDCGNGIEDYVRKINGKILCRSCFVKSNKVGRIKYSDIQLWDFVTPHTTGKPVYIQSKRQWKQHLKEHNLHDDVSKKKYSKVENLEKPKIEPLPKGFVSNMIHETLREKRRIRL
jgi:DNA topoisomerase VI subunit B